MPQDVVILIADDDGDVLTLATAGERDRVRCHVALEDLGVLQCLALVEGHARART